MQNINFITKFVLQILQGHWIVVIFSTLGMSQLGNYQFIENCDTQCTKNQLHPSLLS